ncbi:galactose-specific lectin nattectin-like [Mytilus californianus]|uniref:galactose-specific lectin nattectin-like n=1 Tax=Mytilus californianus TaxID=6549 RepID=UPI0022463BA0|nr:galactose-specific lectin nattectin-like [Mytilus californianus]
MADSCFWSTFNNGTCELLSISRTEINNLTLIANNGGLPTYQMVRADDSSCIKYYVDGLEYAYARTICKRDGGELLRIDSQSKQDRMVRILKTVFYVTVDVTVQGTKENSTGNWLFDDGTLMNYFKWNANQPSNGPPELYLYLNANDNWKWNDIGLEKKTFLCEIRA